MSELSAKLSVLKGSRKTSDLLAAANVSRETFRKIERGESVKLSTLRQVADALGASEEQWLDLLVAWLQAEAGPDYPKLWIEPKDMRSDLRDIGDNQVARAMMLFRNLNASDRAEITKAMERPEVRACLPAINSVWEKFDTESSSSAASHTERKIVAALERDLKKTGASVAPPKELP